MRISEILLENEQSELQRDVVDLLIAAKASGIDSLETEQIVDQLNSMGHSVSVDSLLSMFDEDRPDIIQNITANTISIDSYDGSGDFVDDDFQDDFEKDTTQQAMQNIKDRADRTRRLGREL